MKLHLPKGLNRAVLSCMAAAAVAAASVGSTAYAYRPDVPYGGDCFAGPHEFVFVIGQDTTLSNNNSDRILSYTSGGTSDSGAHTWCRYVLNENNGVITLSFVRTNGAGAASDASPYTFAFVGEYNTLSKGVVYTIKHDGVGNGAGGATAGVYANDVLVAQFDGKKNCNMNNNTTGQLLEEFNNTFSVGAFTWTATGESATLDYTSANWSNDYGFTKLLSGGDVVFAAGETLAKTINIASTVRVDTVTVNDNYTLKATVEGAKLDATTVTIAQGKKLTLDGVEVLLSVNGYKDYSSSIAGNGTLSVTFGVGSNNHSHGITLGEDFSGTLSVVGGKLDISGLAYGSNTSLELVSGEVWGNGNRTINKDIKLNAANLDSSIVFAYDALNLTGKVTGNYFRIKGGNAASKVTLNNAETNIQGVKVQGGQLVLEQGSVGTVFSAGGTTNIQGGSVTDAQVSGGNMNISGGEVGNLQSTGGTTTITAGGITIGDANTTFNSTHKTGIYVKDNGTVNIGNGTSSNVVSTTRIEMGDSNWSGGVKGNLNANGGILNVKSGATLVVTGSDVAATGSDSGYHTTGIIFGEWGAKSTMNIDGTLLAKNASVATGDATGVINVKNGGILATKGVKSQRNNDHDALELNLEDGGKLILGETGITADNLTATLAAGTIGITEDSSITRNIALSSTSGTTFNTAKYTWGADGASIAEGTEGGTLTISGVISDYTVTTTTGEGENQVTNTEVHAGKLIKDGAGTLKLTQTNTYTGGTEVKAGKLVAATGAALGKTGTTTISGGSLEIQAAKATITKSDANTNATITYIPGAEGSTGEAYGIGNSGYKVENAKVELAADSATTISNRLIGVELVNNGAGTITAGNGYNDFTSINAASGDIILKGLAAEAGTDNVDTVANLSIGENRTLSVYSNWQGTLTEATVKVTDSANFASGAIMNGNLVLSSGATVTMAEALTMGSTLTLGTGMELDGALLTSVTGLTAGNTVALFTGVDGLTLGSASYDADTSLELGTEKLGTYFGNVSNPDIYLGYNAATNEVYAGVLQAPVTPAVPEPTTATLSLLALAALAARRRRK